MAMAIMVALDIKHLPTLGMVVHRAVQTTPKNLAAAVRQ
jgi:hypothetical protein